MEALAATWPMFGSDRMQAEHLAPIIASTFGHNVRGHFVRLISAQWKSIGDNLLKMGQTGIMGKPTVLRDQRRTYFAESPYPIYKNIRRHRRTIVSIPSYEFARIRTAP